MGAMPVANRIQRLLEEILNSKGTPEDVCQQCPELVDEVRSEWKRLQGLEAQVEALFPTPGLPPSSRSVATVDPNGELPALAGYEVQALLGRGGMGAVYRARHVSLNREVAIKLMLTGAYADRQRLTRFLREAETIAGLQHPNIVQVYEAGNLDGVPYFTMEFVEGGSLAQQLVGVPRPVDSAATMAATLARAVHLAHQCGVVHRDPKPGNVLLTADGTPKIGDFGLAQRLGGSALTESGVRLGTPSYMAPEQALGQASASGPAVDVYGLGAILYEMLTGRPPFKAETAAETERQLIAQELVAPGRLHAKVPRDLETICLKCLQKEPQRRYATAAELAEDLERFQRGEPISARRSSLWERGIKLARRRPAATALAAVSSLVLAALAVGPYLYQRQLEETRQATRAATLVQALAVTNTPAVGPILEDLQTHRHHADPLLARILATAPADSKARLHASLALVLRDASQLDYLIDRLLIAEPDELQVICSSLAPYKNQVTDRLWGLADDEAAPDSRRFRAACGLAVLDHDDPRWGQIAPDVSDSLVAEGPLLVGAWTGLLRPARLHLLA